MLEAQKDYWRTLLLQISLKVDCLLSPIVTVREQFIVPRRSTLVSKLALPESTSAALATIRDSRQGSVLELHIVSLLVKAHSKIFAKISSKP